MRKQIEQLQGRITISLEYENRRWRLYRIWNSHSSLELGALGLDKEQQTWTLDAAPIKPGAAGEMIELERLQGDDVPQFREHCVKLLLRWRHQQLHRQPRGLPSTAPEEGSS